MMKAKVVPNDMQPGRSFVCLNVARDPYLDGVGRPLRDANGNIRFQMEPALINHDVPDALAQALVEAWNAHPESESHQRAPERQGRPKMLASHFTMQGEPRVAKFWLRDRQRNADDLLLLQRLLSKGLVLMAEWDMTAQSMLYVAAHPDFPMLKPSDEVPQRHLLWQGNRFIFSKDTKCVTIEPKTNAPDWSVYQRLYPDCEFRMVWP